jgi:hypothetical protein
MSAICYSFQSGVSQHGPRLTNLRYPPTPAVRGEAPIAGTEVENSMKTRGEEIANPSTKPAGKAGTQPKALDLTPSEIEALRRDTVQSLEKARAMRQSATDSPGKPGGTQSADTQYAQSKRLEVGRERWEERWVSVKLLGVIYGLHCPIFL